MGVSLGAVAVLVIAAAATACVEPRFLTPLREAGPDARIHVAGNVRPQRIDPWLYPAAPILALVGVCWAMVVIPLDRHFIGADLQIGVFYYLVVVDFVVLGIAIGGWGANTPNAVEACYRIVAQLVSYVVPLGMAVIGPIMMARSLSTVAIVEAQHRSHWYVVTQPLGFALYLVTGLIQVYRHPFLEPFADRIDRGIVDSYGGWKAAIWRFALTGVLFVVAAMGAVLFLGGYRGPGLPGPLWLLVKTFALMALMVWGGRRVRPLGVARMLALSWKVLIPVGLFNVLLVGVLILFGVGQP